jgi:hypothetical protein
VVRGLLELARITDGVWACRRTPPQLTLPGRISTRSLPTLDACFRPASQTAGRLSQRVAQRPALALTQATNATGRGDPRVLYQCGDLGLTVTR